MATDPPAADLEALDAATRQRLENVRYPQRAMAMDVRTILAAYDEREALLERIRGDVIRLIAAYDAQAQEIVRLRTEVERLRDGD